MRRLLGRALPALDRPWAPAGVVALAVLLVSPALGVPPMGDDYMQMARVDPRLHVPGFPYAPLDLFTFVRGDAAQRDALREEGVFGWWMAPDFRMSFWRPLSSLTHLLDHALWPRSPILAHVHSLAWFVALLAVVAALYRRLHPPAVAHLALLLYAVDDARAWVVAWTANRNALVAAALAFAALLVHDRARRDGSRGARWLALLLFAAALAGGEAALAVTGYLLAHALYLDEGPLARRLGRLGPYALLSAAWLAAYTALGYGTTGGGMYLNPLNEPAAYLRATVERLPVLAAAQTGLSLADAWLLLPVRIRLVAFALALLWLVALAAVVRPLWQRDRSCRFWTLGALLSFLPVCATFPMDRLVVFPGVGAMAVVALLLADWSSGAAFAGLDRWRRAAAGAVAGFLCAAHLLLAPLLLPLRVLLVGYVAGMGARLEASIPVTPDVERQTLVILSSAAELTVLPPWMQRQVSGTPRPHRMRVLATCFAPLRVSRIDGRTLRIRPANGFLDNETLRLARGPSRPFRPGDEVALSDLRVRVRDVTPDGRPAEADFTFAVPLEDSSLLWRRLQAGGTLAPWTPPAVGRSQDLPSIEPRAPEAARAEARHARGGQRPD
jgi:hypothetical protein